MESDMTSKIEDLTRQQAQIQDELRRLGVQCEGFERGLRHLSEVNLEEVSATESALAGSPVDQSTLAQAIDLDRQQVESATPPPLPREDHITPSITSSIEPLPIQPQPEALKSREVAKEKVAEEKAKKESSSKAQPSAVNQKPLIDVGEWELNFGQVWLVRIGVVFLLTGLIFLSTYAYKNWLFHSGPGVKVAFFMTISMALAGTGLWLEKWKDRFKQYGRALAAGGLAAGYYTIYASHFTPALKVISSPVLAGLGLTIWAGVMLGYAVWKQSRIVAVMAIGLAFYGTIINPAGWLALFSSLLLSSAGMWLLLRFRWIGVGLGTVIAAYVAHAFWLGYYPSTASESIRLTYLACYWVLFTAALAVPQARTLNLKIQRGICAINNTAAWTLTVFLIPSFTPHQHIGWISIGMGAVWILIAAAIRYNEKERGWHRSLAVIFGYQGILIISLGILLEATGYTRFLIMAVEACVLLVGARYFGGTLARIASVLALACALITALPITDPSLIPGWASYGALALVCAAYTVLMRRDIEIRQNFGSSFNLLPSAATWVVMVWGVFGQWDVGLGINGLWLTATAIMLAYFLMKRPWWLGDLAIPTMFIALGGGWWFLTEVNVVSDISVMQLMAPIACAAVYWWMIPRLTREADQLMGTPSQGASIFLEWVFSIMFWLMLAQAIDVHTSHVQWVVTGGVLAIAGNAVAHWAQRRSIGIPALFFHLIAIGNLLNLWGAYSPWLSWMPALLILLHLALADTIWPVLGKKGLRVYLSILLLLSLLGSSSFRGLDRPDLMLSALGLGIMAWAYRRDDRVFAAVGAAPALVLACLVALTMHPVQDWGRYIPILAIMLVHGYLWVRRNTEIDVWLKLRALLLTFALLSLFIASSLHVRASFEGSGLSICWALIAMLLFGIGLLMRCRPYRLVGLIWLAAAVVHVVGVDVMRLGSLGRILSFITLGVVLLVLGFLYNRFQETIRKFL